MDAIQTIFIEYIQLNYSLPAWNKRFSKFKFWNPESKLTVVTLRYLTLEPYMFTYSRIMCRLQLYLLNTLFKTLTPVISTYTFTLPWCLHPDIRVDKLYFKSIKLCCYWKYVIYIAQIYMFRFGIFHNMRKTVVWLTSFVWHWCVRSLNVLS